jgi:hypothetical protein
MPKNSLPNNNSAVRVGKTECGPKTRFRKRGVGLATFKKKSCLRGNKQISGVEGDPHHLPKTHMRMKKEG